MEEEEEKGELVEVFLHEVGRVYTYEVVRKVVVVDVEVYLVEVETWLTKGGGGGGGSTCSN